MKLLHVINSFEGGGAEKIVLYLHENYLNAGIDSHALSFIKSSINNVPNTHCLGLDTPYQFSILSKLYNFLSQPMWQDLDIIHVQLFHAQLCLPIFSKLLCKNAKLVFTEQASFNNRRNTILGKIIDIFSYSFYAKIVCVSPFTLTTFENWLPQFSQKLLVIDNGIYFQKYSSYFNAKK
jgi:glycosyltransferase involved in cell wall biosynthesis